MVTQLSDLDLNKTYSYADYLTWQLNETVELIKGKIMLMSPAPSVRHQDISMNLSSQLYHHFKHKPCRVYTAPFDVRLYNRQRSLLANEAIFTVVQPDLCVVCNLALLDAQGCNGAPDWVIEILSPGNSQRELKIKYALYQESGVSEYWLVYPEQQTVHQFVLDEGAYRLQQMYTNDEQASPQLFPELAVDINELFR